MAKLLPWLALAALVLAMLAVLQPKWCYKNARWQPGVVNGTLLYQLGDSALAGGDVPVAAVLIYQGAVIGTGYNTVAKTGNAGGHAEINAISAALTRVGQDSFGRLDREDLVLLTTWEPCAMCRGAIIEYNIGRVAVVKPKPIRFWWQDWKKQLRYEWQKQLTPTDSLQETLFRKHPGYAKEKLKTNF